MKTTIDKAGRLVVPRAIRERIGLAGGGEVELTLEGSGIRLEPVAGRALKEVDGLLVIPAVGLPLSTDEVRAMVEADRHDT